MVYDPKSLILPNGQIDARALADAAEQATSHRNQFVGGGDYFQTDLGTVLLPAASAASADTDAVLEVTSLTKLGRYYRAGLRIWDGAVWTVGNDVLFLPANDELATLNRRYAVTLVKAGSTISTSGTLQSANATTATLASTASATDDFYNGATLRITSGPGSGEEFTIADYGGAVKLASIDGTFSTVPTSASEYAIDGLDVYAHQIDGEAGSLTVKTTNPGTGDIAGTVTGVTVIQVDQASGLDMTVTGNAALGIAGVTNTANPTITTSTPHSLVAGDPITIANVGGATGVNGSWNVATVPIAGGSTFTITLSTPPGLYTAGGGVTSGNVTIKAQPASVTHAGVIALGDQVVGTGIKRFTSSIIFGVPTPRSAINGVEVHQLTASGGLSAQAFGLGIGGTSQVTMARVGGISFTKDFALDPATSDVFIQRDIPTVGIAASGLGLIFGRGGQGSLPGLADTIVWGGFFPLGVNGALFPGGWSSALYGSFVFTISGTIMAGRGFAVGRQDGTTLRDLGISPTVTYKKPDDSTGTLTFRGGILIAST